MLAADMSARQQQLLTDIVDELQTRLHLRFGGLAIYGHADVLLPRHTNPAAARFSAASCTRISYGSSAIPALSSTARIRPASRRSVMKRASSMARGVP